MKKAFLLVLALVTVFNLTLIFPKNVYASEISENDMLDAPESNVDQNSKKQIIKEVTKTSEYREYKKTTDINKISKDNIVINKHEETNGRTLYSVEFIFGEKLSKVPSNPTYIELKYVPLDQSVIYDEAIFTKSVDYGNKKYIYLKSKVSGEDYYEFYINETGQIYDMEFNLVTEENLDSITKEINGCDDTVNTFGICEWTINALCAGGTSATCFAIAAGLGITTAGAGLSIAVICGIIYSQSCSAATERACG